MTKDTEEFSQCTELVASREYTLPRNEKSSDPKGWIRGNTKIGPVLEVTTSYLQGNMEWKKRIESVNKDKSHSWVRISHGLNKFVTDLSHNKENDNNEQETSECSSKNLRWRRTHSLLRADQRLKQIHKGVLLPARPQELYPSGKESGLMLSQKIIRQSLTQCQKNWVLFFVMVIYLEKKMERLNSGD